MAKKVRWLKGSQNGAPAMRTEGQVETNDDDLCATWVAHGVAEYVDDDDIKTTIEEQQEDYQRRCGQDVPEKAVKAAPYDKAVKARK